MAIQNFGMHSMKTFLNDVYYIPMNQRDYAWEEEQIEDFWEDLCSVISHSGHMHFFGQLVVFNDTRKSKKYIIDGQQRTVTSMIFLRSIKYVCEELESDVESDEQKSSLNDIVFSLTQSLGRPANKYDVQSKLHLNFENEITENDYFINKIINGTPSTKKQKDSSACENMRTTYLFFYNKLKEALEGKTLDEKLPELYTFRDALLNNFEVMYLETNDLGESYVIFETLNARGKDLEISDLLKNYVFSKAEGNLPTVQVKWQRLTNELSGFDLTKYIRYYWNARYGLVREKDLYREISATITTPKESADFVTDLNGCATYYHDILMPDSCDMYDDKDIIAHLSALKMLRAVTFIPILLALEMQKDFFTAKNKADILQAIETYIVRNATIAGKTANFTEKFFATIAHDIYTQKYLTTDTIIDKIKSGMISDMDFYNSFYTFTTKTTAYIRYILIMIHNYLDKNHEINRNPSQVNKHRTYHAQEFRSVGN